MGLEEFGYLGLFLAGLLAATILPFSSEGVLAIALLNNSNPLFCLIAITTGNWLGGLSTYGIGYLGKIKWMEKYFKISHEKVLQTQHYFTKYGSLMAFLTWLPIVGDLFALSLGYFKVNFLLTSLFMLIGKMARYIAIIYLLS